MMEQAEVQARVSGAQVVAGRALSNEVRASLEAVRVAQEAARVRARRQTLRTRLWFAMLVGAGFAAAIAVGPRVVRWRQARTAAAAPARPVPAPALTPPAPVAPTPSAPAATAAIASAPAPAATITDPPPAPAREVAPPAEAAAQSRPAADRESRGGGAAAEGCDAGLARKAPWLVSPEACTQAFEADPNNAVLALAIAHAEHVRGHVAECAQWAKRALALDPNTAEAYILIARTDADSGRPEDAQAAYKRYLEIAPRGWHQAEARTGVRHRRAGAPLDSTRAR
jgi:tetratricopeptide (TPR) repeat protein